MSVDPSPVFSEPSAPEPIFDAPGGFGGFRRSERDARAPRSVTTAQLCGDPPARRAHPADAPISAALADLDEAGLLMLAALEKLGVADTKLPLNPTQAGSLASLVSQVADRGRAAVLLANPSLRPRTSTRRAYEKAGA